MFNTAKNEILFKHINVLLGMMTTAVRIGFHNIKFGFYFKMLCKTKKYRVI